MGPTLTWSDIFVRLGLTLLAGALIGLDRDEQAHPAGLRTTVLIALAASVAMIQAHWLTLHTVDTHNAIVREDIMRLPLGILSGVGFIGAGVILRRGEMVRGITSAATIWITTVIGLCFGGGELGLGTVATALALLALWAMKYAERGVVRGRRGTLCVTFAAGSAFAAADTGEQMLYGLLDERGFSLRSRQVGTASDGATHIVCHGVYRGAYPAWSSALVRDLSARPEIGKVEWSDAD